MSQQNRWETPERFAEDGTAIPAHGWRQFWQAIDEGTAVQWMDSWRADGDVVTLGPDSLVMYKRVTFDALRSIPLTRLQPHRTGYPEFDQVEPPTEDQIRKAWKANASARSQADKKIEFVAPSFVHRQDGESTDDFYARVAEFYRNAVARSGQPTKSLSQSADVPKTTAARWVREARQRGFLSPTERGKGRS